MIISAIVATAQNGVIGKNNSIPWYLQADLKFFKKTTLGHHVIMGRNSYESIGRPLPNRTNIVITRNPFYIASGCMVVHSLPEALALARSNQETEAFVIGGGEIYKMAMPYFDRIYLTEVEALIDGDVFFPELDDAKWKELSKETYSANDKNDYNFTIRILERLKS